MLGRLPGRRFSMDRPDGSSICNFWHRFGNCKFGDSCKFAHPTPDEAGRFTAGLGLDRFHQQVDRGQGPPLGRRGPPSRLPAAPADPAFLTRKWWTAGVVPPAGPRFRVMSYNVLADELAHTHRWELYRGTPAEMLLWPRRWALIKAELEHYAPDVVCLQEVDHWDDMYRDMAALGFQGTYAQRSGGRTDGCATFWRSASFEQVATSQLKFVDFDLRDNVGLLTLLCHKQPEHEQPQQVSIYEQRRRQRQLEQQQQRRARQRERQWQQLRQQRRKEQGPVSSSEPSSSDDDDDMPRSRRMLDSAAASGAQSGPYIAVANVHVLFNPKRGDVKIAQLRLLVKHLQALVAATLPPEQVQHVSTLVMGDMNHQPNTPIYNFMREGWVDCLQQHRKLMAGTHEGLCVNQLTRRQQQPQIQQPNMMRDDTGFSRLYDGHDWYMQQQQQLQRNIQTHPPINPMSWANHGFGQCMQPTPLQTQPEVYGGPVGPSGGLDLEVEHGQGMHGSASTSAVRQISLRRIKDAGWSVDELVTATGGAAGTHLQHYLQLEQAKLEGKKRQNPQQLKHEAVEVALVAAKAAAAAAVTGLEYSRGPGNVPAWQQQQQQQAGAAMYDAMYDHRMGYGQNDAGMDAGDEMELEVGSEEQQQQHQGSGARELSPETRRLKEQHQKAVKSQMRQHARAREALLLNRGSRDALEDLQLQQKKEASMLKRQNQQQLLQRQFDKAAHQLRLQQQLQGFSSVSAPKKVSDDDAAAPPPPPPPQQQPLQQEQHDAAVPPPPPSPPQQQQQQAVSPCPARAPQQQMQQDVAAQSSTPSGPVFTVQSSRHWPKHRWDEPLPAMIGDGIARHGLQLRSCYAELTGAEPEFTSCHDSFYGTVDYIWFSPEAGRQRLQPVAVLLPPDVQEHLLWMRKPCLPNASIPSDHISLVCDLELKQVE